ncbi:hypothetical protein PFISCL1PPCAC_16237, partial [Pristionchus fissidentatus]
HVNYQIQDKLGSGAFGAVYKVYCIEDEKDFAMKCEPVDIKRPSLRREYRSMRAARLSGSPYFTDYGDRGRDPDRFMFLTMELVGENLFSIVHKQPSHCFTTNTACRVAEQTLAAIRDLHAVSFLHRDIKPPNFAIGRKEDGRDNIIYLLDFGMCKTFRSREGKLKHNRKAPFRGTQRYASCGALLGEEQSRKDDIESWFYMTVEFTMGYVPWNSKVGNSTHPVNR